MFKTIGVIALVLLFLIGGALVYQQIRGINASLKDLKETDAAAQATIDRLTGHVDALQAENKALEARDAAGEEAKAKLREERDEAQAKLAAALQELQSATPERLLAVTRSYLNTTDVWLRVNAAGQTEGVFSLDAFRLDAQDLERLHHLEFSLVPSLQAEISTQAGQLQDVRSEVSNLKQVVIDKDGIIGTKDGQLTARDVIIESLKKSRLISNLKSAGYGAAIATALILIFGK